MERRYTFVRMITHVSDTAHWVAMYRAMESERPDALFRDPWAGTLAGPRGAEILHRMPRGRAFAWPMIVRTAVMDEIILRAVRRDGVRTVANLAAGLDTRPYRLDLPAGLRWLDVDFADVHDYKRAALAGETPRCALEWVAGDLSSPAGRSGVLDRLAAAPSPALVVTEGLLIYLAPEQVAELAEALAGCPTAAWWLSDLASPRLLRMMERTWGRTVSAGGAPFRFAPAQGTSFFEPHGWHEVEWRSTWSESLRLGRTMRFARFWNFIGRLYPRRRREEIVRMTGMVLLARTSPTAVTPSA